MQRASTRRRLNVWRRFGTREEDIYIIVASGYDKNQLSTEVDKYSKMDEEVGKHETGAESAREQVDTRGRQWEDDGQC